MREERMFPLKIGLLTPFQGVEALHAAALAQAAADLGVQCELVGGAPADHASKDKRRSFEAFLQACAPLAGGDPAHVEALSCGALLAAGAMEEEPEPALLGRRFPGRRGAYALFFGAAPLPEELTAELAGFSHVSFQAEGDRTLFRQRTGRGAALALDPLLLLPEERWETLCSGKGDGCVLWCGGETGPLAPYLRRLTAETGLPLVRTGGRSLRRLGRERPFRLEELLGQFRRAAFVCTDSFTGTALALLFHKPFFTALPPGELLAPERSRTFTLLHRLGLEDRIVDGGGGADPMAPIDWLAVDARLAALRRESLALLQAALTGGKEAAPVLEEEPPRLLAERELCTGCTACASACPQGAIAMARDREGFAYPAVDGEKCVRCGVCGQVCPVPKTRESRSLPAAFAAWNRDEDVRRDSASGGVFSALADFVLEGGGVAFGAALDGRQSLRHAACFSKEELWRFRGTKFVQSDLTGVFPMVRECLETRQVLFCGTPCQVAGLYAYLGCRPERLVTCDLVCGGAPSPGLWEDMVQSIESSRGKGLQAVRFCNKVTGWRDSHLTLVYDNGTVDSAPLLRTEYGRALSRGLLFRPSCYRCPYASMTRPGDFTLGDFPGLRPGELPREQEKGVSLLLVNTPHASHVFDQLPLACQAFPAERAIVGNPALASPPVCPPERAEFFAAYALEPFEAVRRRYLAQPPLPLRAVRRFLPAKPGRGERARGKK